MVFWTLGNAPGGPWTIALKVPIVLFLVGFFLLAALACLTIGAFSRSARRQRRFVIICGMLLVPSLILSSLIALFGQGA